MESMKTYPGLQMFTNDQFGTIRVLFINAEPWIIGVDVTRALGYKNNTLALKHVDNEDKRLFKNGKDLEPLQIDTPPGAAYQNNMVPASGVTIINESGLYALILSSKLPNAKAFKKWVTGTVLPSIRKQGGYNVSATVPTAVWTPPPLPTSPAPVKPKREPSFEQVLQAADLIIRCGNDRLPFVLAMLRQYGFEIPDEPIPPPGVRPGA